MVESQPSKLLVVGSIPISRSKWSPVSPQAPPTENSNVERVPGVEFLVENQDLVNIEWVRRPPGQRIA